MNLKVDRQEACRIMQALTHIKWDYHEEYNNPKTTEDRKKIIVGSVQMWDELRAKVSAQIDAFDEKQQKLKGGAE